MDCKGLASKKCGECVRVGGWVQMAGASTRMSGAGGSGQWAAEVSSRRGDKRVELQATGDMDDAVSEDGGGQ